MTTPRLFALTCLFAAGPFLLAQEVPPPVKPAPVAQDATAPRAPAAPVVGVVDLAKAIENYPRWIELQQRLDAMDKQAKERAKQFQAKLEDLRGAVKITNPETDEGKQAQFQLEIAQQEFKWLLTSLNEKLELEDFRGKLAVYEDLERAVPIVAKARGVSIVLRVHNVPPVPPDVSPDSPRMVNARLRAFDNKQVWFASEEVDLTPDLIKYLMVPRDAGKGDKTPKGDAPAKADAKTDGKTDGAAKAAGSQQGSK